MVYFTPCKINLGLHVLSKREDGYHNIETCFYPVPWMDIVEIVRSNDFAFSVSGTPISGREEENLCVKAYNLLKKDFNLSPVHLHLHKIIPTGAGLGGGSSDAVATLKILNEIFSLKISGERLRAMAASLGSDCPFFVESRPALGSGTGARLVPLGNLLAGKFLVLVNTGISVPTAEAYRNVLPRKPKKSLVEILNKPIATWRDDLVNDFETSIFIEHPSLLAIKTKLYDVGSVYASMSGSGSTLFGLFDHVNDPSPYFPGMTVWSGLLS